MDQKKKWRKFLNSGNYRRKVNKYHHMFIESCNNSIKLLPITLPSVNERPDPVANSLKSVHQLNQLEPELEPKLPLSVEENLESVLRNSNEPLEMDKSTLTREFHNTGVNLKESDLPIFLRNWSLQYNIRQQAMKPLLHKLNHYDNTLPTDPRRLLQTPRNKPCLIVIGGGEYWHQGIENCLRRCFAGMTESKRISININIDGLPLFNNGTDQVWPILFNIHNMPEIDPMVIGIFHGRSKPKKVEEYLEKFVEDILPVIQNGLLINGFKLNVGIRAFICDSPARAFIKGVVNFNSQHGCLKCCTIGYHSSLLRTNIFPDTSAVKRTDFEFRQGLYREHQQVYTMKENGKLLKQLVVTPLLKLPIDIIEDIVVSDSLHLLHLGVMKKLLLAFRDGHNGLDTRRWSKSEVNTISEHLVEVRLPVEIHRSVRGVDSLSHWKASECASFFNYIGIVILKQFVEDDIYQTFTKLFCAVTICSSDYYCRFLTVANLLFKQFINSYSTLFNSATSNIHNLSHVVDEVHKFGPLPTISSYPFENHLYKIKKLVRTGRLPLQQIVNRLSEKSSSDPTLKSPEEQYPHLESPTKYNNSQYHSIKLSKSCTLKKTNADQWFLTKDRKILSMDFADMAGIHASELIWYDNWFTEPFPSMNILVFHTKDINCVNHKVYSINQFLCK